MEIIFTDFARNSLKEIYNHYELEAGAEVAKSLIKRIIDNIKYLYDFPEIGKKDKILKSGFRYIVKMNYKIVYLIKDNTLFITDIFDVRQNPDKLYTSL